MTTPTLTAAMLVIGNEILSGSTQDANVAYIGKHLAEHGIKMAEVRIVGDVETDIVEALNALRHKYTYVFTTGGIGPTHDDITAETVAKAFGVTAPVNAEAKAYMEKRYAERGMELNEARLRMARIPEGGSMILCDASIAPAFKTGNVFSMAGIPLIMREQFAAALSTLPRGKAVLSRKVQSNLREGEIAFDLEDIQKNFTDVDIGSYPHYGQTPSLSLILRGTDAARIDAAVRAVEDMVRKHGENPLTDAG